MNFFSRVWTKLQKIQVNGKNVAKNVSSRCKDIENWSTGLKDTSLKAVFERDYTKLHPCHIKTKVGEKGYIWPHIGPEWRKVAEVG